MIRFEIQEIILCIKNIYAQLLHSLTNFLIFQYFYITIQK
jgi:hypothetical protein